MSLLYFQSLLPFLPFVIVGSGIGVVSGFFGVGGGFLLTPILLMMGYSPMASVAASTSFISITSFFSLMTHVYRKTLIYRLGIIMSIGGFIGLGLGWVLLKFLEKYNLIDTIVLGGYTLFLFFLGTWLMYRTLRQRFAISSDTPAVQSPTKPATASLTSLGCVGGFLSAILGIGGGIFLIPLLIEGLSLPILTGMAIVQLQTFLIACINTAIHLNIQEETNFIMILCLALGGILGTQIGQRAMEYFKPFTVKVMLACLILLTSGQLLVHSFL